MKNLNSKHWSKHCMESSICITSGFVNLQKTKKNSPSQMFSSTMLLELAQWCAPFNFTPTVFPQINFFCCQWVKFSFCPLCSSEVVFTFPPLKQLLDTVWQVLIVSFFFSFFFSFFLSFLAMNRIILNSAVLEFECMSWLCCFSATTFVHLSVDSIVVVCDCCVVG